MKVSKHGKLEKERGSSRVGNEFTLKSDSAEVEKRPE